MKAMDAVKLAAVVGAGFVAVRVAIKARDAVAAGADLAVAVKDAVVKTVTTDLNPASTQNLAYRGVNSIAAQVTNDPDWNLGVKIWEWLNPDKLARERELLGPSTPSNTRQQAAMIGSGPQSYVDANWDAMAAADQAALAEANKRMGNARDAFRASEIREQNAAPRPSFLN